MRVVMQQDYCFVRLEDQELGERRGARWEGGRWDSGIRSTVSEAGLAQQLVPLHTYPPTHQRAPRHQASCLQSVRCPATAPR